ncbi:porin family protein [Pseudoduganella lutea]|uniref:Porin family protein n=1 Tax=Pseudoduganella lutea TaxID=321985 RepID=A0A4P6L125_9BURK|nr:porin family protein [Pseudoduganella lutea]QBE64582.1 porin family protein [Pseudoduganella lutea]
MFKKFIATAALSLAASASFAMPTGIYAGVTAGTTDVSDLDGNKGSFGAFAGYGFNEAIAVEVGYRQHGTWELYGSDVKVKQTDISVLGALPLAASLDLYGRLGYAHAKVEAEYYGYRDDESVDNTLVGIGLAYRFSANLSGRVEVQKPASDTTNVSLGLAWQF